MMPRKFIGAHGMGWLPHVKDPSPCRGNHCQRRVVGVYWEMFGVDYMYRERNIFAI